ncbi:MAG: hypothetical protein ABR597_02990 [Bacteroidales bacterium]
MPNFKSIKKLLLAYTMFSAVLVFAASFCGNVYGQARINSPYSMFGPGELKGNEFFRNMGLGGVAQGFRSNTSVNYINPASYTAMDSLSFVFDATVFSNLYQQKQADQEQVTSYSSLGNFNFAFPVTRWWSVATGILPYSQVGYRISDSDQEGGMVNYLYEGKGGINQVYLGHGFKLFKGLSAGINVSYLFGKSEDLKIAYSDSIGFFRTIWSYTDDIDGLLLTYGLQYERALGQNSNITLGATYSNPTDLKITRNQYVLRDLPGISNRIDTLNVISGGSGTMEIPQSFGAGVFIKFNNHWSGGADYQTQSWSEFSSYGTQQSLNDSWQIRTGMIYNPTVETYSTFLSRWEYRAGFRFGQSFLNYGNADFSEFGISFGVELPLRRSLSAVNIGFEYSSRSAGNEDLISENFFRFNLGVNIYERWFVRRKFY